MSYNIFPQINKINKNNQKGTIKTTVDNTLAWTVWIFFALPLFSQCLSLPPHRFLQVCPACVEDESLLVGIVTFLNAYFKQIPTELACEAEDRNLHWILELLLNQVPIIHTLWMSMKVKTFQHLCSFFFLRLWLKRIHKTLYILFHLFIYF